MKFYILLISLFIASCQTTPSTLTAPSFNQQDFLDNFDSVNQKIRGDLSVEKDFNLSRIELKDYEAKLNSYQSSIAEALRKDLGQFQLKLHNGVKNTFIICAYSQSLRFSVCDDARCGNVENFKTNAENVTAELRKNLPKVKCGEG